MLLGRLSPASFWGPVHFQGRLLLNFQGIYKFRDDSSTRSESSENTATCDQLGSPVPLRPLKRWSPGRGYLTGFFSEEKKTSNGQLLFPGRYGVYKKRGTTTLIDRGLCTHYQDSLVMWDAGIPFYRRFKFMLLPRKLTYPLKNDGWKILVFLNWFFFRGH